MKEILRKSWIVLYYATYGVGLIMIGVGLIVPIFFNFWLLIWALLSLAGGVAAAYGSSMCLRKFNNVSWRIRDKSQDTSLVSAVLLIIGGILSFFLYVGFIGFFFPILATILFIMGAYHSTKDAIVESAKKYNSTDYYPDGWD